jgi:VanZ family protein
MSVPASGDKDSSNLPVIDKIAHFLLFGVLYALLFDLLSYFLPKRWNMAVSSAFVVGCILLSEYMQVYIPGRGVSFYDGLFGALGLLTGIIIIKYGFKR